MCPLPPVLPRPDAMPRPRRFRTRFAPEPGLMSFNRTLEFLDFQEIGHLANHTPIARRVLNHRAVMHSPKTETANARPMRCQPPIYAPSERNPEPLTTFVGSHRSIPQFIHSESAFRRNLLDGPHLREPTDSRSNDIDRVVRSYALCKHILDPKHLKHGAHRPACNNSGTLRRGMHVYPCSTMSRHDRVLQSAPLKLNPHQTAPCILHRLLNRRRHLSRLAPTHSDTTLAVTNHRQCRKPEKATALHNLRYAINRDQLLLKIIFARRICITCHRPIAPDCSIS